MVKSAISLLAGTLVLVLLVRSAGNFLVVHRLHKADVILVLAGDTNDVRFWRGIELLRNGYGPQLLVDARKDSKVFGQTDLDRARRLFKPGLIFQHTWMCALSTVGQHKRKPSTFEGA
jgi:hypothetical protein